MADRKVISARDLMQAGGVDPDAPFKVGPFPAEMRERPPMPDISSPPERTEELMELKRRYHVEGQTSTQGPRWLIWDGVDGHFARYQNIADEGDARALCQKLNEYDAALQSSGYAEMERENARLREALACSQEHIRKMLRTRLASKTKHRTALRGDREQGEG